MVIYVGNLSIDTCEQDLKERFERYGPVKAVNIIRDEVSGNMLGFAFVKMLDRSAAHQAVAGLHRTKINNRIVMVCETAPRIERRRGAGKHSAATHNTSKTDIGSVAEAI